MYLLQLSALLLLGSALYNHEAVEHYLKWLFNHTKVPYVVMSGVIVVLGINYWVNL